MEYYVTINDRAGTKVKMLCNPDDTIGDIKILIGAQAQIKPEKLRLLGFYHTGLKDHVTLEDYEVKSGTVLNVEYAD